MQNGTLNVTDQGRPVTMLNELEYINGEIWANVWQTDRIARISPFTGNVVGWIDLKGLLTPSEHASADVLNGIAYDSAANRVFVTGKLWPKLFEIKVGPPR
jgi:glutamine cyclotransferase